jgi:glycosyltransferase involved in cell wall biosynthesis
MVSTITCCYNYAAFLPQTLDSLVRQTRLPAEVIVIDDGSTDDSAAIAEAYGPPVRVIRQENRGQPASRNVGIQAARGDYLLFIDADDLLHPTALERLTAAAEKVPGAVAVMGCAWFHEDPAAPFAVRPYDMDNFFPAIIQGNFGPQHNRLVPRDVTLRAGCFDPTLSVYEDWHFWCRVALLGTPLVSDPFVGAYYRRHPSSLLATARSLAFVHDQLRIMEVLCRGILDRDDLLQKHGEVLFWCAWTALHRARQEGMSWRDLGWLADYIRHIAQRGPAELRRATFARMIRVMGVRWAETLRTLLGRNRAAVEPAPGLAG